MTELLEILFNSINFPIFIRNLQGKFIFANKEYAELYNKSIEEILESSLEEVVGSTMIDICSEHEKEVIQFGKIVTKEIFAARGYRQCSIIPLKNGNGDIIAIAGIIGVLTESGSIKSRDHQIEMQKKITANIIDILPGIIFYKDYKGRYVYANKACRDEYAKKGYTDIYGKTDEEINSDREQAERFRKGDEYIFQSKNSVYDEVVYVKGDGTEIVNEVVKIPVLDSYGNITGIVGRCLDITDRKVAQEKLEYLSYTDILTGVKNRTSFEERQLELSTIDNLPLGLIMGDVNGLKLVNDTFGHGKGDELLLNVANILNEVCYNKGEVFRFGGDEFIVLLPNSSLKECEEYIININQKCSECINSFFKTSISLGSAIKCNVDQDIHDILKIAEDKAYRQKLLQNESIKSSILNSLKIGLGVNSGETEQHTERVSINAVKVGKKLELEMSELDELKIAGDFHDIGKIGISEDILLKPGPLTTEEYEVMKTHSEKGYRIIKASSELKNVAECVLYHHERWDGLGYPMGLKGEAIPLLSRIISVCDAYDVMTNNRVYKRAISKEDAIKELKDCAGRQFDPKVVHAFIECI